MTKPTLESSYVAIERDRWKLRVSRVGCGPLVNIWIGEEGRGGRSMILDVEKTEDLIEGLNDVLDEIEAEHE